MRYWGRWTWILVAAALLLVGAVGCSGSDADQLDRDRWLAETRVIFEQDILAPEGEPVVVLPSHGWDDVYTMALAVAGSGERAEEVVDSVGRDRVVGALTDALADDALDDTAGDELYTAAVFMEADAVLPFLSESDVEQFGGVVDRALQGSEETDVVDAVVLGDLASRLDYRTTDVAAFGRELADRFGAELCPSAEGPFPFTIASAVPGHDLREVCGHDELATAWDTQAESLAATGGHASQGAAGGDDISAACMEPYWLARSARELGLDDDARMQTVSESLSMVAGFLRQNLVAAPIQCARDVQRAAQVLGAGIETPDEILPYVRFVLSTGAEPVTVEVDAESAASFVGTAMLLGRDRQVPLDYLGDLSPLDRLRILAAQDARWADSVADLVDEVARTAEDNETAGAVVAPAMLSAGEDACESSAGLHLLESLVSESATRPQADEAPRVAIAQASRVLDTCERPSRVSTERLLADWATSTLSAAEDASGGEAEERAGLVEGWESAAILCALEPSSLPPAEELWESYASHAVDVGGATFGGGISLEATRMLAGLATADEAVCDRSGQLGAGR